MASSKVQVLNVSWTTIVVLYDHPLLQNSCSAKMPCPNIQSRRSLLPKSDVRSPSQTCQPLPDTPAAQVWVHACVCVCVLYMYLKWSLPILWPWEASDLSMTQRRGWAFNLCQHPVWLRGSFNNGSALFMQVFAQKGLDATKTIMGRVLISSSVPIWVSRN